MSLLFAGLVGAVIAFFLLRAPGRALVLRHILAFVIGAVVAAFLSLIAFQLLHPRGSGSWAAMYNVYAFGGMLAAILGPIVGMVAAAFWRGRKGA
jgi:uncharacterized membrane protein YeaQ/YmgE (transglycosylase-associated protein family)